jgi:hypothetical protein
VQQVGYIQELYRDARSTEYKIIHIRTVVFTWIEVRRNYTVEHNTLSQIFLFSVKSRHVNNMLNTTFEVVLGYKHDIYLLS